MADPIWQLCVGDSAPSNTNCSIWLGNDYLGISKVANCDSPLVPSGKTIEDHWDRSSLVLSEKTTEDRKGSQLSIAEVEHHLSSHKEHLRIIESEIHFLSLKKQLRITKTELHLFSAKKKTEDRWGRALLVLSQGAIGHCRSRASLFHFRELIYFFPSLGLYQLEHGNMDYLYLFSSTLRVWNVHMNSFFSEIYVQSDRCSSTFGTSYLQNYTFIDLFDLY